MGRAVIVRSRGVAPDDEAELGWRGEVERELAARLGDAGFDVRLASDVVALLGFVADGIDEAVLVVDARVVLSRNAVRALAEDPRVSSGVLVRGVTPSPGPSHRAVRADRGVVVAASSPLHAPIEARAESVGAVVLDRGLVAALPGAVDRLLGEVGDDAFDRGFEEAPVEVAMAALLAEGHRLSAVDARGMVAVRVDDDAQAAAARKRLESTDDDRAWLDAAVKARDGFFTTFFVSPYTRFVARFAARRRLTPNQVTTVSMLVGLFAAAAFAYGTRASWVVGAVALQAAFALDCVDGQLARYTQQFSSFGAWLDSIFDRGKEYVVYAGLAIGAARAGTGDVWDLAAAALALLVVRHMVDFSFAVYRPTPAVQVPTLAAPVEATDAGRVLRAAAAAEDRPLTKWGKRIIVFPIGERFAVISLTAALATPDLTFRILLIWGVVAAAYTLTGRLLRARRFAFPDADRAADPGPHLRDDGLLRPLVRVRRGWRWALLVAPLSRAAEYGVVLWAGLLVEDAGAATYAALAALALRHYDLVYRGRTVGPGAPRDVARIVLGGWQVRTVVVLVAAATGVVTPVLWLITALVGGVAVVDAAAGWLAARGGDATTVDVVDEEEV